METDRTEFSGSVSNWPRLSKSGHARVCASIRKRSRTLRRCPHCHEMKSEAGYTQHVTACLEQKQNKPIVCQGHKLCACERRMKPAQAQYCFLCEDRDKVFDLLDRLISAGIDTPRGKLEGQRA